jgi:hypothetical protein
MIAPDSAPPLAGQRVERNVVDVIAGVAFGL